MKKFSKLMVAGAAAAALMGSVVVAQAGSALKNTDGSTARSPLGTILGSATLFAVIRADGTTARGDGNVQPVIKLGVGVYDIRFFRNVLGCAYIANIGGDNFNVESPGFVTVTNRAGANNGIFLTTHNSAGTATDKGFHLFVNC